MKKYKFNFDNKNVVILGATSNLSYRIIEAFYEYGTNLHLIGRNKDKLKNLLDNFPKAKIYSVDIQDRDKLKEIANTIKTIDIMFNFVGGNLKSATTSEDVSFFDLDIDNINKALWLNIFGGAIIPTQIFGKAMAQNPNGGSIVNISSMTAIRPLTKIVGYSMAKAAVENFTKWLSVDIVLNHNKKVRVNSIAPGFFLTEQNKYLLLDDKENLTARGQQILNQTPMSRFGKPEDLVSTALFLASDLSQFITGICVPVDGGFSAYAGV